MKGKRGPRTQASRDRALKFVEKIRVLFDTNPQWNVHDMSEKIGLARPTLPRWISGRTGGFTPSEATAKRAYNDLCEIVRQKQPQKSMEEVPHDEHKMKAITLEIGGGEKSNTITFKKTITMELAGKIISLCCNG